jgi:recombination protein RecA
MALPAALLVLARDLNKRYGANTVVLGSQVVVPPRIPSGSLSLNVALGGGWPGNTWAELVGEESAGKTAIALKTVAENQMDDPDFVTVWICSEEWNPQYAEMCGVDLDRVMLVETNVMEEAFQATLEFLKTKCVDMVVIDSLPALVPSAEDEKEMGEMTVGRGAMLTNKFFRKAGSATKRNPDGSERPVTGMVINQWRQQIGVTYGDDRTTPGGKGKNYYFQVRVEVRRAEWIEIGPSKAKIRVGQSLRLRTLKNKTAPPQQVAYVDFYFADGGECPAGQYDTGKEMVTIAILKGIITRASAWYSYDGKKWNGSDAVVDAVRADPELRASIYREVMDTLKKVV